MPRPAKDYVVLRGPAILKSIRENADRAYLRKRYKETCKDACHCCGASLTTVCNEPLSSYFVMDIRGRFYCFDCESMFEDGDERIYVED